jgi:hypothetical protein
MPDEGNGDFQLFEPLWRLPPQVALPKAVSGDTVNAPFRQQCESEAEWVLNNGEREFEPEQVAPRDEFEPWLTVKESGADNYSR